MKAVLSRRVGWLPTLIIEQYAVERKLTVKYMRVLRHKSSESDSSHPNHLLSWNVLFDRTESVEASALRHQRICDTLGHLAATRSLDVICLQEVSPCFAARLQKQPWTTHGGFQFSTSCTDPCLVPFGQLTLSRCAFDEIRIYQPSKTSQKRVVIMSGESWVVMNVHLTARLEQQAMRVSQIADLIGLQRFYPKQERFVMGDMNFDDAQLESKLMGGWSEVRHGLIGPTFDPKTNDIAGRLHPFSFSGRFDRLYVDHVVIHGEFQGEILNTIQECSDHYPVLFYRNLFH